MADTLPPRADVAARLAAAFADLALPGVVSAYLFGSYAQGHAHRESDVDVAVLLCRDTHPTPRDRFETRVRLASSLPARLETPNVDVVILNEAPPLLGRHVVTTGQRVFCTDEAADHAFVRDVQLRAADLEPFLRRMRRVKLAHLDHLRTLRPRVTDREALESDLSLHNDVLFSLLTVCQLVIDVAGELAGRRGDRFEDYTEAVRSLAKDERFPATLVRRLERLPGFRNVLIHEYVALDMDRVVEALDELEPIEQFTEIVRRIESA